MKKSDKVLMDALPNDEGIKREYKRLWEICAKSGKADVDTLEKARKIVSRAAFLGVTLDRFEKDIAENGYEEEYQNGENQKGKKKSAAADLHVSYTKNYIAVMKQLAEMFPQEDVKPDDEDEFDNF